MHPRFAPAYPLAALIVALGFVAARPAHAAGVITACEAVSGPMPAEPGSGSALELEQEISDWILGWLTTPDGTVGSLLLPTESMPSTLRCSKGSSFEGLGPQGQRKALAEISLQRFRGAIAFDERTYVNLKTRGKIRIKANRPFTFRGKRYPAGSLDLPVEGFLDGQVDFADPQDRIRLQTLEFHFRSPSAPADLLRDLRELFSAAGIELGNVHAHDLFALPPRLKELARIHQTAELAALVFTEFHRRANLVAELISIVLDRARIGESSSTNAVGGTLVRFGVLTPQQLASLYTQLRDLAERARAGWPMNYDPSAKIGFKMSWLGFRFGGAYRDRDLAGWEYRAVSDGQADAHHEEFLKALRFGSRKPDLGIDIPALINALELQSYVNYVNTRKIEGLRYNRDVDSLRSRIHPELKEAIVEIQRTTGQDVYAVVDRLARTSGEEVKMLLYRWTTDPVFYKKAMKDRIILAQSVALQRLVRHPEEVQSIMTKFLVKSGIFEEALRTFGLSVRTDLLPPF